jgi:hypothetical protein
VDVLPGVEVAALPVLPRAFSTIFSWEIDMRRSKKVLTLLSWEHDNSPALTGDGKSVAIGNTGPHYTNVPSALSSPPALLQGLMARRTATLQSSPPLSLG